MDTAGRVHNKQANPEAKADVEANANTSSADPQLEENQEERISSIDLKEPLERMGFDDSDRLEITGKTSVDTTGLLFAGVGMSCMVIFTWYLILVANNPFSLSFFAFHPPLQILAIAFFAYGILTLQPTSLAQPKAKAKGFSRHHLFMFFLGFPSIVLGSTAIIYNKSLHGASHFVTWHGFLGIIALSWMAFQILLGGGSVWFGGRYFGRNPKAVYKYHRASGYPLLLLFLLVIHLAGAWSNFALNNMNVIARFFVFLIAPAIVVFGIFTRIRFDKMPIF